MRNRELENIATNLLGNAARVFVGRAVQHEHELFAAVARREIERPFGAASDAPRDALQAIVACLVAVEVVVDLEEVDVDENDRNAVALAARLPPEPLDVVVEDAAVVEARHSVALGELVQHSRLEEIRAQRVLEVIGGDPRSEERRVGKECRSGGVPYHY